jgi:hypothetical protein
MGHKFVRGRPRSRLFAALLFGLHQVIATVGVMVAAPALLALVATGLRRLGWTVSMGQFHELLTDTPYFPSQVVLALLLGWLFARYAWRGSMVYVWVLPSAVLLLVFATNHHPLDFGPVSSALAQPRLSHFFGRSCRPKNRCFDQIVITLPFYSATAYSVGALLAHVLGRAMRSEVAQSLDS